MKKITIPLFILLMLFIPATASAQGDLTDLSEMFKIFQEARNISAGFDLATQQFIQPIPDDYPLGPGDNLQLMAGGFTPDAILIQVDPQGKILVYPIGIIDIEGLTVAEARDIIEDELAYYVKEPTVELQLLQARKIEVYIVGQVSQPGLYVTWAGVKPIGFLQNASGLVEPPVPGSTIDESDYLSPYFRILNSSASRKIKILRDGSEFAELDVAAILYNGEPEPDLYLENGDVIYAPESERPVIVTGGVVRPGKYEFKRGENLTDVLHMAGGSVSKQFLSKVTVDRETEFGKKKLIVPVNLELSSLDDDFELRPGDIIRVPEMANYVYVFGGVWLPQAVEYREDWRVIDYIGHTGGPTVTSDYSMTSLIKYAGTEDVVSIRVDIKELFKGNPVENPVVEPGDFIIVPFQNKAWSGPVVTGTILQFATFARFLWG